ncbi:MAG: Helix-turn-helix protein [Acidobacteriota bacterium]|nr:Helix-turn-helix protein [Acidobacteriota bacterium]
MRLITDFKRKLRKEIGARLAQLRETLELSKNKMAGKINISRAAFQRNEEGQWFPEYSTLVKLSSVFGVSLDWLLVNKGPMYYKQKIAETEKTDDDSVKSRNGSLVMREEYRDLLDNLEKYPVLRYEVLLQVQKFLENKQGQPGPVQAKEQES